MSPSPKYPRQIDCRIYNRESGKEFRGVNDEN